MTLEGAVVNGVVVPDAKTQFPEGVFVWIELADDDIFPPRLLTLTEAEKARIARHKTVAT